MIISSLGAPHGGGGGGGRGGGGGGGRGGGGGGGRGRGAGPHIARSAGLSPRHPGPHHGGHGPRHGGRGRHWGWVPGWYWGAGPLWVESYAQYVCPVMDKNKVLVDYVLCPEPMVIDASTLPLSGLDEFGDGASLPVVLVGAGVVALLLFGALSGRPSKKRRK